MVHKYDQNGNFVDEFSVWEDIKSEINGINPKNVIISAELLTCKPKYYKLDTIFLIKKILEEYEVKIVLYLRRQDEFLRSYYCELIKYMVLPDIKQFILDWKYQANYYQTIELWKTVFEIENIIVRPMERSQMKNGSLVDDFLAAIKLKYTESDFDFSKCTVKNIGYSGKTIKVIGWIDKKRYQLQSEKTNIDWYDLLLLRMKYLLFKKIISTFISSLPELWISEELLSKEDRISIMNEFDESNSKVAKEYLGREDGRLFYSNP